MQRVVRWSASVCHMDVKDRGSSTGSGEYYSQMGTRGVNIERNLSGKETIEHNQGEA